MNEANASADKPVSSDDTPMTFPQKLMEILSIEEHADIVGWIPHGQAFIIYKKKKFSTDVLPRYFKQSKFTSFTRKLNRWGFSRVTRGPETGSYYHKFFLRDQPSLCLQMSCHNSRPQNDSIRPMMDKQLLQQQQQPQQMLNMANVNNLIPYGMGAGVATTMMPNQNAFMQMQLQFEQMQQQQQFQNELLRRAVASQASATATQAQLLGSVGGGNITTTNTTGNSNTDEGLYMQMLAQSKASTMSAQPLMRAIQNSLIQNHHPNNSSMMSGMMTGGGASMMTAVPKDGEPDRVVPRASAA